MRLKGLSADGAINPHSDSYGYLVFVRKGNNVETAMFAKFINEIATEPFIDVLWNFILWATLIEQMFQSFFVLY